MSACAELSDKTQTKNATPRINYRFLNQVDPEALFHLILALEKNIPDQLDILEMVDGDKPLLPLVGISSVSFIWIFDLSIGLDVLNPSNLDKLSCLE